ncbi:MAG: RluA family pseudouridine synthase [Bacteroidetes bacterium]|nr:MAG: RluA family pseudouridine synthase [Bacteroidota bacterium]
MAFKPEIIYKDEVLLVVNKPPGVLSIPGRSVTHDGSLLELLNKRFGTCFTVHRLDALTSGVICFARTQEAHKNLSMQFQERKVTKIYNALVEGNVYDNEGEIDKPIAPHNSISGRMVVSGKGKNALTYFNVLERFRNFTFLEADIKTGRTHQIRVHMAAIGHPLAVDSMYGSREELFLSEIKLKGFRKGKFEEERPLMKRNALHASKLTITHPDSGETMSFEAPLAKDFRAVLNQLRKWGVIH